MTLDLWKRGLQTLTQTWAKNPQVFAIPNTYGQLLGSSGRRPSHRSVHPSQLPGRLPGSPLGGPQIRVVLPSYEDTTWTTKKKPRILSIEKTGCLIGILICHGAYYNPFYNWVGFHPLYIPQTGFFLRHTWRKLRFSFLDVKNTFVSQKLKKEIYNEFRKWGAQHPEFSRFHIVQNPRNSIGHPMWPQVFSVKSEIIGVPRGQKFLGGKKFDKLKTQTKNIQTRLKLQKGDVKNEQKGGCGTHYKKNKVRDDTVKIITNESKS